jgi:putative membrane protein
MLWIKAWHIIFMVTYFAGAFYLPRLFVYHADTHDKIGSQRFKIMEFKLFWWIMTPSIILMSVFGIWLLYAYAWSAYRHMMWLHLKLSGVMILWIYHVICGWMLHQFHHDKNRYSGKFYRYFNEIPSVLLIAIIILVVVKPL